MARGNQQFSDGWFCHELRLKLALLRGKCCAQLSRLILHPAPLVRRQSCPDQPEVPVSPIQAHGKTWVGTWVIEERFKKFKSFQWSIKLKWRRGWDSNPRYSCPYFGFRDRPVRPLRHLSSARGSAPPLDRRRSYNWPRSRAQSPPLTSGGGPSISPPLPAWRFAPGADGFCPW